MQSRGRFSWERDAPPYRRQRSSVLVNANLSGHDSHGVLRIPQYLGWIADGSLQPAAEPRVVKETPNSLLMDGNYGFGHYASLQTIRMAVEKAKPVMWHVQTLFT